MIENLPEPAQEPTLEDVLRLYVHESEVPYLLSDIADYVGQFRWELAAEFVRRLAFRLKETVFGYALVRALGLSEGETLKQAAERLGVSFQYLSKLQKEAEEILGDDWKIKSLETIKYKKKE